jgi:hypothetical protein
MGLRKTMIVCRDAIVTSKNEVVRWGSGAGDIHCNGAINKRCGPISAHVTRVGGEGAIPCKITSRLRLTRKAEK